MIMKKPLFKTVLLFFIITFSFAQKRIQFQYDVMGNQIERVICSNCSSRAPIDKPKEEDFIKNEISADIQYYPNPVKEDLYLKWTNKTDANIESIELHNVTGQILLKEAQEKNKSETIFNFSQYPQGMYLLVFIYTNGEIESIKILKQ